VFLGSTPIGGPIVGYVSEHAGARWALALGAAATVGAGLYGLATVRSERRVMVDEAAAADAVADVADAPDTGAGVILAT
jgi:hypothetical protein